MLREINIAAAVPEDLGMIKKIASEFDLDTEGISYDQFLVARKNNSISGFGRIVNRSSCTELSTLGVIPGERSKGIGSSLTEALICKANSHVYVVCVIPAFFSRLGFQKVQHVPEELLRKVKFCMEYGFSRSCVSVMVHENSF